MTHGDALDEPHVDAHALDDSDPLAESREADALALKMLSDKRAPDYGTAIQMASREVRKHRTDAALSRLASATR